MFVLTRLTCSFSMVLDFSSVQFQSDLYYGGAASALSVRKGALRSSAAAGNPGSGTVCVLADGPLSSSFPRQFWFARRLPAASRRTRADMLARRRAAGWARWLDWTSVSAAAAEDGGAVSADGRHVAAAAGRPEPRRRRRPGQQAGLCTKSPNSSILDNSRSNKTMDLDQFGRN